MPHDLDPAGPSHTRRGAEQTDGPQARCGAIRRGLLWSLPFFHPQINSTSLDACQANADMDSSSRGSSSGSQLLPKKNSKKAANGSARPQPPRPAVLVTAADGSVAPAHGDCGKANGADVIDAGLKSLHHCTSVLLLCRIVPRKRQPGGNQE